MVVIPNFQMIIQRFKMDSLDKELREEYVKIGKKAKYGTAGFRDLATNIPYIVYKVGAFVTVMNRMQPGKCLGVVLSASHNKIEDNGLKITNFNGNMLEMEYEPILQKFVDEESLDKSVKDLEEYLVSKGKTVHKCDATIMIGGDTRPSTPKLLHLLTEGIKTQGGNVVDFVLTTTPQLQYYVYLYNNHLRSKKAQIDIEEMRPEFWTRFCQYFDTCAKYLKWDKPQGRTIDCANGVGGKLMPEFMKFLKPYFDIKLINHTKDELLNLGCGADFVKVEGQFPSDYQPEASNSFATFDGDADRILLFSEKDGSLQLIDGDRQGTILTEFFKRISNDLKAKTESLNKHENIMISMPLEPTIGFVQTYYANYSSSEYLQKKYGMEPVFAATGVKYLHHKAEHYDIGIYFEANGHGTVIFNPDFLNKFQVLLNGQNFHLESPTVKDNAALKKEMEEYFEFVGFYFNACRLANPSVGDAITNFMLVEVAMKYLGMDYQSAMGLYSDLKSRTSKIQVARKENLKVTQIEDKVVEPKGLQDAIEQVLKELGGKKAFLRASGTENVLRLHVEAQTREVVEEITRKINQVVTATAELN